MKIAIDAIGINKFGGGRTATINLLRAISKIDLENQYLIALSAPEPDLETNFGKMVQWIIPVQNRFLSRIYLQLVFPFKCIGYDVVHFTKNLNLVGIRAPQVVTVFDMTHVLYPKIVPPFDRIYYKLIQNHMLQTASAIIAISHDAAQGLHKIYKIPSDKIRVVYLGVSDLFKPSSEENIQKIKHKYKISDQYFIHVGHLDKKKNLVNLVKGFRIIKDRINFSGCLVLVGPKYPKGHDPDLIPTIKQLHLENDVIFTGQVPDCDLHDLLSGAIAKIFPSMHEGFGLAPLEAMACATPVIASKAGAVSEVIGDTGLLLADTDPSTIADAMEMIYQNEDLRKKLKSRGLERAKEFKWEKAAKQTLQIYTEVRRNKC